MMDCKNSISIVAYRAAKWPVQTLAVLTTLVFVMTIVVAELKPSILPTTLSRTFVVSSANECVPIEAYRDSEGLLASMKRYVGSTVSLPIDTPKAVMEYVSGIFRTNISSIKKVVLPEDELERLLSSARIFDIGNTTWELKSTPSWLAYFKFFFGRLSDLLHAVSWFDIGVVTAGWIGMQYSFVKLFLQLREFGSRTFLFITALFSSGFAFVSAYALTVLVGCNVPKSALVQGLPFFVLVVGFDNKVKLTREAFFQLFKENSSETQVSAAEAVKKSVSRTFGSFTVEAFFEAIALLFAGFVTLIPGLFEFSILSAIVLVLDLVFLVTFYTAGLSLKLAMARVEHNNAIRKALLEDGVAQDVAKSYADEVFQASKKPQVTRFMNFKNISGSIRLLLIFFLMGVNWIQIVEFPISYSINRADFTADNNVSDFEIQSVGSFPFIFTILPSIKFVSINRGFVWLNNVINFIHSRPAIRAALIALIASLMFNGYLVSLVMRQDSSVVQKKVPVLVEVPVKETSKNSDSPSNEENTETSVVFPARSKDDCIAIYKAGLAKSLNDEELVSLVLDGTLPLYALEKQLADTSRAVVIRRAAVSRLSRTKTLETSDLPHIGYNYDRVLGACCENVIGYMPIPVGIAGPLVIDNEETFIPMATTEGVLVASAMRGCKALNAGGGVTTEILGDGMTRGPCVTFGTASRAAICKIYLDSEEGTKAMMRAFNSTSRFARLESLKTAQAGPFLYIRFRAQTGDAMGMNMISKGTERALQVLAEECGFDDMTIVSVSGNYCTDKKAAAVNWIEGRGKSVIAESIIPGEVVQSVLKTGVDELVELNMAKNLVGSAVAGVMGGYNAHAANLVAAVFIATGQDPAQVVEGSNCMTLMSNVDGDLQISVTMPSIEVGTIGGGTILGPQGAMLNMLGIKGPHATTPGANAKKLARIVAAAVLAGELSLNSALAAGHLVKSHMAHNRAKPAPSQ